MYVVRPAVAYIRLEHKLREAIDYFIDIKTTIDNNEVSLQKCKEDPTLCRNISTNPATVELNITSQKALIATIRTSLNDALATLQNYKKSISVHSDIDALNAIDKSADNIIKSTKQTLIAAGVIKA